MDDEKTWRLNAVALLAQRADNGSLVRDADNKAILLDAAAAKRLLGACDSADRGQGAFDLLVPKSQLKEVGLAQIWEKTPFISIVRDGKSYYCVDYMQGVALLDVLQLQAGCSWDVARTVGPAPQETSRSR